MDGRRCTVSNEREHDRDENDEERERLNRPEDQPPPNDDVDGDEMGEPDDEVREAFGERDETHEVHETREETTPEE
jgi:hypothetical protein